MEYDPPPSKQKYPLFCFMHSVCHTIDTSNTLFYKRLIPFSHYSPKRLLCLAIIGWARTNPTFLIIAITNKAHYNIQQIKKWPTQPPHSHCIWLWLPRQQQPQRSQKGTLRVPRLHGLQGRNDAPPMKHHPSTPPQYRHIQHSWNPIPQPQPHRAEIEQRRRNINHQEE